MYSMVSIETLIMGPYIISRKYSYIKWFLSRVGGVWEREIVTLVYRLRRIILHGNYYQGD